MPICAARGSLRGAALVLDLVAFGTSGSVIALGNRSWSAFIAGAILCSSQFDDPQAPVLKPVNAASFCIARLFLDSRSNTHTGELSSSSAGLTTESCSSSTCDKLDDARLRRFAEQDKLKRRLARQATALFCANSRLIVPYHVAARWRGTLYSFGYIGFVRLSPHTVHTILSVTPPWQTRVQAYPARRSPTSSLLASPSSVHSTAPSHPLHSLNAHSQ